MEHLVKEEKLGDQYLRCFVRLDRLNGDYGLLQQEKTEQDVIERTLHENTEQQRIRHIPCPICLRSFSSKSSLQSHKRVHRNKDRYVCEQCNKAFYSSRLLTEHKFSHTDYLEWPLACSFCMKRFIRKEHLKNHERLHTKDLPFACSYCDRRCTSKSHLREHELRHSAQRSFACPHCDLTFFTNQEMTDHRQVHGREERNYVCWECLKAFERKRHFVRHWREYHSKTMLHECPICNRRFLRKYLAAEHILSHDGEKIPCSSCGKLFSSRFILRRHLKIYHSDIKPMIFVCEICKRQYTSLHSLNVHMRTHSGEKPFVCDRCGKRFNEEKNLARHYNIHTGKRFPCSECPKTFARRDQMLRHVRFHKGEIKASVFACSLCSKVFASKITLSQHEKIHSDDCPHRCETCFRNFSSKHNLSKHMSVHTGNRPFVCNECGKSFIQEGNLKPHMLTHRDHSEWPFNCASCEKRFKTRGSWKLHQRCHMAYDERPFACSQCSKRFMLKVELSCHITRIHDVDKRSLYVCCECHKELRTKYQFLLHFRSHNFGKSRACRVFKSKKRVLARVKLRQTSVKDLFRVKRKKHNSELSLKAQQTKLHQASTNVRVKPHTTPNKANDCKSRIIMRVKLPQSSAKNAMPFRMRSEKSVASKTHHITCVKLTERSTKNRVQSGAKHKKLRISNSRKPAIMRLKLPNLSTFKKAQAQSQTMKYEESRETDSNLQSANDGHILSVQCAAFVKRISQVNFNHIFQHGLAKAKFNFFTCNDCRSFFADGYGLRVHRLSSMGIVELWCSLCGECFESQEEVKTCFHRHKNSVAT